ncbi:hypothetical protein HGA91_03530 [candidate division WWE3 bacterium]|nr:hypothetical protein [candidate division WWE3 bacterium]
MFRESGAPKETPVAEIATTEEDLFADVPPNAELIERTRQEAMPAHQKEYVTIPEKLGYTPFDAVAELELIRQLRTDDTQDRLSSREEAKQRIEAMRPEIEKQRGVIAVALEAIHAAIDANPDVTQEELMKLAEMYGILGKLTHEQMISLRLGIDDYVHHHQLVKKTRQRYPKREDLFTACFGFSPKHPQRLDLVEGPMTVSFRCDDEDYMAIQEANDPQLAQERTQQRLSGEKLAVKSIGESLPTSQLPDLEGLVIIERTDYPTEQNPVIVPEYQETLRSQEESYFDIGEMASVEVDFQGQHWNIEFTDVSASGLPETIIISADGATKPITLKRVENGEARPAQWIPVGTNEPLRATTSASGETVSGFPLHISEDGQEWIGLEVMGCVASLINSTGESVAAVEKRRNPIIGYQKGWSSVERHEQMHVWNKVYDRTIGLSYENRLTLLVDEKIEEISAECVRQSKSAKEVERQFILKTVREARQALLDHRVRDEILAFYEDGTETNDIVDTLTKNPLYDYTSNEYTVFWRQNIEQAINDQVQRINTDFQEFESGQDHATPEEIADLIDITFSNYKADIPVWTSAIEELQKKGYDRTEIINRLRVHPLMRWGSVAKHAPKKKG